MRDDDDGKPDASVDVADEFEYGFCRLRVKRRGRLIAQQHLRISGEGARNADALLLSAGEMARIGACLIGKPNEGEEFRDLWANLICGGARQAQRKCHIVIDRRRGQQVKMLENHADAAPLLAQLVL